MTESIDQYYAKRKRNKDHRDWLKECKQQLPELAATVFSLRKKHYMGCGFHYSLEKQLGKMIVMCNDFDTVLTFSVITLNEVCWEMFIEDINRIKEEIK